MIIDEIKKANIIALKEKNLIARSIYSVILNKIKLVEIEKREKGDALNDVDVVLILQKLVKELEDEKQNYIKANNKNEANNIQIQIDIAKTYLPKMLSQQEIFDIISSLEDKSVPNIMKYFKSNYNGKCDMREVSEVLKRFWYENFCFKWFAFIFNC